MSGDEVSSESGRSGVPLLGDFGRCAKTVAHFMRNKNQIGLIVAVVTVMLLAGCSTNRRSQREVTYSDPPPLTNLDSAVNDRRTWIDGPF